MMPRSRPVECLLITHEPGLQRQITLGKLIWIHVRDGGGYFAYVNDVTVEWDLMRDLDAWGIAPCVLERMARMGIDEIHFCCKDEGVTYIANVGDVHRFGELKQFGTRGAHWHLPRRFWGKIAGIQMYRRTNRRLELEWLEPEVVHD